MIQSRFFAGMVALGLAATSSSAQQSQDVQEGQQTQIAQECFDNLRAFGQRIQEEGYWLTGVRDRWGAGTGAAYPGAGVPATPVTADPNAPAADVDAAAPAGVPGWGLGIHAPGNQIETLFRAAQVLAIRGDQEGCEAVSQELTSVYDEYATRLQETGVDPGQVTTWRQEMLLTAQPVSEMATGRISADEVIDRDVRNLNDEYLGDIEDVLISDGEIEYVVISHGGFLGLGEDYAVVPWDRLSATPGLGMLVLDVDEQTFENAPRVTEDVRQLSQSGEAQVSEYWQQGAD